MIAYRKYKTQRKNGEKDTCNLKVYFFVLPVHKLETEKMLVVGEVFTLTK